MIYIVQNLLPILVATLAGLTFGAVYNSLVGHAEAWRSPKFLAAAAIAEFWFAAILAGALILAPGDKAPPWIMAVGTAVVIWIGFVVPALVVALRGRGLPALAECGHWLGVMVVQAVVLKAIGLVPPAA